MHDYYSYDKARLLNAPKIPLEVMSDADDVFRAMADDMIRIIQLKAEMNEPCLLICPVGPIGQYPFFVKRVNKEQISLKHVWIINMDEYLTEDMHWISTEHPLSFRGYMQREVYGRINSNLNVPESQRIFPCPGNLEAIPEIVSQLGCVDAVFGGIGLNGHIAFNEPQARLPHEEFLALPTRVLEIAPETRACNAIGDFGGNIEDMPRFCVTVGMSEIASARMIRLGVFRSWHGAVVRRAAYGECGTSFPVTLLQNHADTLIRMPQYVVAK